MQRNITLLLILVVVGAVSAVGWLMLTGPLTEWGSTLDRGAGDPDAAARGLLEDGSGALRAVPGAKAPPTEEELEALRKAALKPAFPKSEGVFGHVVDGEGEPVPQARVLLIPRNTRTWWATLQADPPAIAQTLTNEHGEFLVGPAPEGLLKIRAEAAGYAPSVQSLRCRGYRVDLVLDRGGGLDVTVKDADGALVAGATVLHSVGNWMQMVVTEAVTDESGNASFSALPTGTGSVLVMAPGHAALQQTGIGVAPGAREARTFVLPDPLTIEGRILTMVGEQPLPGASIVLRYPMQPWLDPSAPVTSDEAGHYEVEALAPRGQQVTLEVSVPDRPTISTPTQLHDAGEGRMTFDLKVPALPTSFVGRVEDVRGHAVRGARVTYPYVPQGQEAIEVLTAADGTFELPGPPWAIGQNRGAQIIAIAPGEGIGSGYARGTKEGQPPKEVKIRLSGTGTVKGTVVDGQGTAVEGALVLLEVDWQAANQRGRRVDWGMMQAAQNPDFTRLEGITDPDGAFLIEDVPELAYRLTVSSGLDSMTDPEPLRITGGDTVTRTLTLGDGLTLAGWIRDGEGQPVAGAQVTASPAQQRGGGMMMKWISGRSQADGRFVLRGVVDGDYNVGASAAGFRAQNQQAVRGGTTDLELTLVAMGWVKGRVELNGIGYAGTFTIRANRARNEKGGQGRPFKGRAPPPAPMGYGNNTNTFSPDDGTFRLTGLASGEYDLLVTTPEGWISTGAVRVRIADGRESEATLTLSQGSAIRGRLVSDLTGEPVVGARLYASARAGAVGPLPSAAGRTDSEGNFVLRGLGSGPYAIRVSPPSGVAFEQSVDLQIGEERVLSLREQAPGSLRILVTDADGVPVPFVEVTIQNEAGRMVWPNWQALQKSGVQFTGNTWNEIRQTDGAGVNLRRFLAPGRYQITVPRKPNREGKRYQTTGPVWAEARAGRTTEVTVVAAASKDAPTPNR